MREHKLQDKMCGVAWCGAGINSIMFYAPIIFKTISPANGALLSTVIMGAINVAATFISVAALDKSGRKARAHLASLPWKWLILQCAALDVRT